MVAALALSGAAFAQLAPTLPAFPGAEGFGAVATGGRGGQVIHVTTLDESGPGSLREALETRGARVIVFDVSGVIDLGPPNCDDVFDESPSSNVLVIPHSDVTIAGQTAPGAGITIRGRLYAAYDEGVGNFIVRHVRIRPPAWDCGGDGGEQYDALRFAVNDTAIFDHVSVSWGVDENIDTYRGRNVTLQWSVVGEPATEGHPEGEHNYGILNDGGRVSVLHNLFAHAQNRNPALARGPGESIGNTAYNVRHGFVNHNVASGEFNLIANSFVQGPDNDLIPYFFDGGTGASYWVADTRVDDPGELVGIVADPWAEPYFDGLGPAAVQASALFDFTSDPGWVPSSVFPAESAANVVAQISGAFPRDVVDDRMVQDLADRTGAWGARYVDDLLEGLTPAAPPTDSDGDGMADDWERANGLDPADGEDHATVQPSGYTAIEDYVNCLADTLIGADSGVCGAGGTTNPTPTDPTDTTTPGDDDDDTTGDDDDDTATPDGAGEDDKGCGCGTGAAPGGLVPVAALLVLRRRRQFGNRSAPA